MHEVDNGIARKPRGLVSPPKSIFSGSGQASSVNSEILRIGQVEQQLGNIEAVASDIKSILDAVEMKLRPIMHQSGAGSEMEQANELVPLAAKMQEQYLQLSGIRDRLQNILKEVDL